MGNSNIIYSQCPNCPNDQFEIIQTLVASKTFKAKKELVTTAGYYRCECTLCKLPQTFKSKTPDSYDESTFDTTD